MTHALPWQTPARNYYPLPKVLCRLGLSPGEIAVYSFLMYCENRTTYQCYPSYRTIGEAVGMSRNTVAKYVRQLEEKGLIRTERTTVTLKDGRRRNGSLLYTILPPEQAVEQQVLVQAINQFLYAQPARKRNIFIRRYWYLTPIREIAKACGMTESKTASLLFRMRKELKTHLEREGIIA